MKTFFVSFIFFLIISNSYSQNLQGYIEYKMEFYGPPSMKATLHFSENESCFISNKFHTAKDRTYSAPGVMVYVEGDTIGKIVYKNIAEKKTVSRQFIKNRGLIVNDTLTFIDWELSEITREIGGYKCQKATAKFKGREYEVWFTPDIPISTGPWKLWGLPGLILEGKDKTGQVVFDFSSLKIGKIDSTKAKFPYNSERPWLLGKEINKVEYNKLVKDNSIKAKQDAEAILLEGGARMSNFQTQWIEKEENDEK
jgi:GLPGLI family protein